MNDPTRDAARQNEQIREHLISLLQDLRDDPSVRMKQAYVCIEGQHGAYSATYRIDEDFLDKIVADLGDFKVNDLSTAPPPSQSNVIEFKWRPKHD